MNEKQIELTGNDAWNEYKKMKIGETIRNIGDLHVIEVIKRVPNGWVFIWGYVEGLSSTFIPI